MTSKDGGGIHPGDPWHPDWQSPVPEPERDDEWPYDESLTLSDAELEIAESDDEELEAEEKAAEEPGADETPPEAAEVRESDAAEAEVTTPEADTTETDAEPALEEYESESSGEPERSAEAVEVEEPEVEQPQPEAVEAKADSDEVEAAELEEGTEPVAASEVEAAEVTEPEVAEVAEPEVAEVAEPEVVEPEVAEVEAAEVVEPEVAEAEAAEVVEPEVAEVEAAEVVEPEVAEVAEPEVVEPEVAEVEAAEVEAAEAAEPEVAEAAEVAEPEVAEPEVVEPEAKAESELPAEADEVMEPEGEATGVEEPALAVAEVPAAEVDQLPPEVPEAKAQTHETETAELEQGTEPEVEAGAELVAEAREVTEPEVEAGAELVAEAGEGPEGEATGVEEPEVAEPTITREIEDEVARDIDDAVQQDVEDMEPEELEGDADWMGSVEELSLDIDDVDAPSEEPSKLSAVPDRIDAEAPVEAASAGRDDSQPVPMDASVDDATQWTVEEVPFEVVDLEDHDLRADTAEHYFDALDFEDEVDHDHVTAEIPKVDAEDAVDVVPIVGRVPTAADEVATVDTAFEVPPEYVEVTASVDETRHALAAFMKPRIAPSVEDGRQPATESPVLELEEETGPADTAVQLTIPTGDVAVIAETGEPPVLEAPGLEWAKVEREPEPLLTDEPETPEEEIVAALTQDLDIINFETFVRSELQEQDYVQAPTQEHIGLAEEISGAAASEPSPVAAAMPGLSHGHVGFDEFEEELEYHDPDREDVTGDEAETEDDLEAADGEVLESDLALRVASAVVLASMLVGALWIGGVAFLLFLGVVAIAGQIEFYTALRKAGYRPMVLFGLIGGIGALVGTFVQGNDVPTQGPVAVPAALALTVVATFAWYGSQETPPREPWANGVVTVFAVAWIPALLAFILPVIEASRSTRLQLVFVLLVMVAAFDVGSYFVGRALGSRKLSPVVSPNKTIEGLIGGVIATIVVSLIAGAVAGEFDAGTALALAVGVIIASPFGDLAESVVKRSLNVKDMGQIIPGHGGVLDRIDSYLFVVPVAYLVFRWTNLI